MPDPGSSPWLPDGSRKRPRVPLPSSAAAAFSAPAVWPRAQCGADLLGAPCLPPPLRPRWRAPVMANSSSCVALPPQVSVTSATSSCRDTFPPQPPSGGGVGLPPGTMMEAWTNAKNEQMRAWLAVAVTAAAASPMVTSLLESAHATPLLLRLVQANAPSTLSNYLGRWKQWQSFCDVQSVDSWSPSVSFMCDFLITHCKGQLGSAVGWLKALPLCLFPPGGSVFEVGTTVRGCFRAFGKSVNIVQRRETAPFPLSFVIWLERQVLDASQTAAQRIRCGFLLVCVFASLRWSDAQWSPPSFLHCERQAMLGTAVRTKTTSRSMPWGAWAPGFLARPQTAAGWGQIWLCLVQEAVVRTTSAKPGFRPDFLVADLGPDEREPVSTAPLNPSAGVVLIRQLLTRCYEHVEPARRPDLSLIGVHSAKGYSALCGQAAAFRTSPSGVSKVTIVPRRVRP